MDEMSLFANATVDAGVPIALHTSRFTDSDYVSILFGDECVTLDFFDVASLERLRDIADEGARRLRAMAEASARECATGADASAPGQDGADGGAR